MTPSNPMSLESIRNGIDSVAHTLNTSLLDQYINALDAELKRRESEAVAIALREPNSAKAAQVASSLGASPPSQPSTGVPDGWVWYHADLSCLYSTIESVRKRAIVRLIRDALGQRWWHSLPEEQRDAVELYITAEGDSFESAMRNACVLAAAAPRSP
jgi:histone H3/H4